jgi:hypothetical protein
MTNPYLVDGPAIISFSGGRSGSLMRRRILDAYHGTLAGRRHPLLCQHRP